MESIKNILKRIECNTLLAKSANKNAMNET